jgi:glycosyltransferase involved in cell wall biosynthesis
MNVAIFTDNDFSKVNGVTTTLRAVLDHTPADVHARIYTCEDRAVDSARYLALSGPSVGIPFYGEMKMHLPPLRQFLRRAAADDIDLVHLTTPGPVGLAGLFVASRLKLPMIGSFHTDLAQYTRLLSGSNRLGDLMQEYLRWPYGRCQQILAPSEMTRSMLIRSKIDPAKIRIWRRGVSTERFMPGLRSADLRSQWGISDRTLALLYVGRLSAEKGLDDFGALCSRLSAERIDHRLIVVGDGPFQGALRRICPTAVFTGTLTTGLVAQAMASSDVFVFPSRTDTAGNVVLEAQASGLPVLVTDAGGPQENMIDGETGYVCADIRAMARRITALAWNAERRATLSRAARAYALARRWDEALDPLYRAYRDLAKARGHERLEPQTVGAR